MAQRVEEQKKKEIFEAINKESSQSLKKKLVLIEKLNEERTKQQEDTYEVEYLSLKKHYDIEYEKVYNEISEIVKGSVYPTISAEELKKYEVGKTDSAVEAGIPEFWLNALQNASNFVEINENDEKILKHLTEVKVVNKFDKLSYTIEFHFSPNEWFTDAVLTKTYNYDVKDHQLYSSEKSGVNWKSEDKIPNKVIKTKTIKSNLVNKLI
jgi:nucleosome assembly protein 1-like 1